MRSGTQWIRFLVDASDIQWKLLFNFRKMILAFRFRFLRWFFYLFEFELRNIKGSLEVFFEQEPQRNSFNNLMKFLEAAIQDCLHGVSIEASPWVSPVNPTDLPKALQKTSPNILAWSFSKCCFRNFSGNSRNLKNMLEFIMVNTLDFFVYG